MFGFGWAPDRAFEPFISVPVPTVKPRTGWIGGEALPPDTLRHELLPVAAPPRGVASAWGGYKRCCGLPQRRRLGSVGAWRFASPTT
jgi:hypothetical protein